MAAVWDTQAAGSMGRTGSPSGALTRFITSKAKQGLVYGEDWLRDQTPDSPLGRVKQLRGFGSQHLATVKVMGLEVERKNDCLYSTDGAVFPK